MLIHKKIFNKFMLIINKHSQKIRLFIFFKWHRIVLNQVTNAARKKGVFTTLNVTKICVNAVSLTNCLFLSLN